MTAYRNATRSGGCRCYLPNVYKVSWLHLPRRIAKADAEKVNGNHLAADGSTFLEKRRKGLVRFTNALVQHPVLSQETLVVMFLTVPTVRHCPLRKDRANGNCRNYQFGASKPPSQYKKNSLAKHYLPTLKTIYPTHYQICSNK